MKKQNLHGHRQEHIVSDNQLNAQSPALAQRGPSIFKLGLDVDIKNLVVAIQCDHGAIKPAQKFTRERLTAWVKEKVAQGHRVYSVYESCGFGFTLHHDPIDHLILSSSRHPVANSPIRLSKENSHSSSG